MCLYRNCCMLRKTASIFKIICQHNKIAASGTIFAKLFIPKLFAYETITIYYELTNVV